MSDEGPILIVGHLGQDGTLLRESLDGRGGAWIGVDRDRLDCAPGTSWDLPTRFSVFCPEHVEAAVARYKFSRIYYLAAMHCGASSKANQVFSLQDSLAVNVQGVVNFLEAIRQRSPQSRFMYASSSLIYGPRDASDVPIIEDDAKMPSETYAYEKLLAGHYCQQYRDNYGVFASVAILFNHESRYRPQGFFTRDVTDTLARISRGQASICEVGSTEAIVDWLYAGDVVDAMERIAGYDRPDDFIVASGTRHTTGDFLRIACETLGLDMDRHVRCRPGRLVRKNGCRIGNPEKLTKATGWRPQTDFRTLVDDMTAAALKRINNGGRG